MPVPPALQQTNEPSPELFERLAVASPHADAGPVVPPAENYYPRSKSVSPVQKKIRELEVGAGAGWVGAACWVCIACAPVPRAVAAYRCAGPMH